MTDRSAVTIAFLIAATAATAGPARADDDAENVSVATAYLAAALRDTNKTVATLATLARGTQDPNLLPIFESAARSGDKRVRLAAVTMASELAGKAAVPMLMERLSKDPIEATRAAALIALIELEAIDDGRLTRLLAETTDEGVLSLAAGELARRNRGAAARKTLDRLAASSDTATAALAQVALVKLGSAAHREPLVRTLNDPKTPDAIVLLIMQRIAEDKVTGAGDLARLVAMSERRDPVRVAAYQAVNNIFPDGAAVVREALIRTDRTVFQVYLLRILAGRKDAASQLAPLASRRDTIGALARFELARPRGGAVAERAVTEAVTLGHPIILDYILSMARKDVDARGRGASFYTAPLLAFIGGVAKDPQVMLAEHYRAATAATIVTDIGTAQGVAGLRKILIGRYTGAARAAGAGIMRAKGPAAAELAADLLKSPYEELIMDGALTLGRLGRPQTKAVLSDVVAKAEQHPPATVTMAAWYVVKLAGASKATARSLAATVK